MSDEEYDYDIAGDLALNNDTDESDEEIQDIIESDNEEAPAKKQKPSPKPVAFPSLELSDDEDEVKDMASYFVTNNPLAKKAKAGSFASFGFSKFLNQNIAKKGFRQPTPIQRKTIPLIMDNRDVVGMARTGSGKTAAFTLPLIEKLKTHSARVGIRAIILSPLRELALQTYKQVKEFSKGTDLRSIVLIGGDSLDEQFSSMMSNPDIIIATPGRFLHLKVEMDLDLKTVEYICFDEADRLFEMGFAEQLNELIAALPPSRQSLLFSATLPRSLVEFAKAGLTSPVLVRLDAETKISDQLQMSFFTTKKNEREANLLYLIQDVIKIPIGNEEQIKKLKNMELRLDEDDEENEDADAQSNKRKRFKKERLPPANVLPLEHSTIVFVPTKHHVEYITNMLKDAGYLCSYIYGSLDQHARKNQLYQFRIGLTTLLVVTDVAARGLDIPVLANVINFTLPGSSKIFIHRVGRTARAGNKGWAYSIVNEKELPYLLDLELFLGRKILLTSMHQAKSRILKEKMGSEYEEPKISYNTRLVLGSVPRSGLEQSQEFYENLLRNNYDLTVIKDVSLKGEKLYQRTRQAASPESIKRSKELMETNSWDEQHLIFGPNLERAKEDFLLKLNNRYVKETVFEFNHKKDASDENSIINFMTKRRRQLAPIQRRAKERRELLDKERLAGLVHGIEEEVLNKEENQNEVGYTINEEELMKTFEDGDQVKKRKNFRDPQFFMNHYAPAAMIQDQQLSLATSFANDAALATFDLENDEKAKRNQQTMQWDSKKKNYVNSQSTDKKFIIGESGQKIPASYKSGRFDDWKRGKGGQNRVSEKGNPNEVKLGNNKFKHNTTKAPKLPDKFRDDFQKQKKKVEKAMDGGVRVKGYNRAGQKQEIRSTEDIRKARGVVEQKKKKNARPTKRRK